MKLKKKLIINDGKLILIFLIGFKVRKKCTTNNIHFILVLPCGGSPLKVNVYQVTVDLRFTCHK